MPPFLNAMRLAMGRSGRIQRLPLLLLLVVLISAGAARGKPQGAGGEDSADGDYGDNYDEYNPVDYEPEYEEGKDTNKNYFLCRRDVLHHVSHCGGAAVQHLAC